MVIVAVLLGVVGVVGYLTFGTSPAPSPPAESNPVTAPAIELNQESAPTVEQAVTVTPASVTNTPELAPTQTSAPGAHATDTPLPTPTLPPPPTPEPAGLSIPTGKGALTMFNCFAHAVNVEIIPGDVFQTLAPKTGPNCESGDPIFLNPGEYTLTATFADRASEGKATIFIEAGGILNFDWQ